MSTQRVARDDSAVGLVIVVILAFLMPPLALVLTTAMLIVERKYRARQRRWVPVLWLSLFTTALCVGLILAH